MLKMSIIKTSNHFLSNTPYWPYPHRRYAMTTFPYDAPTLSADSRCATKLNIEYAKARIPVDLPRSERLLVEDNIKRLLKAHNAVLVAHYYVDPFIQELALATGGCVGDSLEMARFGQAHSAQTLVVAGVRFMGESAKILSMEKTVLMPDLEAECSLDLGCPADEFTAFCDAHPERWCIIRKGGHGISPVWARPIRCIRQKMIRCFNYAHFEHKNKEFFINKSKKPTFLRWFVLDSDGYLSGTGRSHQWIHVILMVIARLFDVVMIDTNKKGD